MPTTKHYEAFCKKGAKDFDTNIRQREIILAQAENNSNVQKSIMEACAEDVLFFFNAFCWLYEPRPRKTSSGKKYPSIIPFITWDHQDPIILSAREAIGYSDVGIEKSRGEGASWMFILLALHDWIFEPMSAIGFISRTELAVDNPDDPDSLFWKADWELTKLPPWMVGEKSSVADKTSKDYSRNVSKHILKNNRNGSQIVGYSATGDVTTGGRKGWILFDELAKFPRPQDSEAMASTQHVTESRILISTPKGAEGEYYKLMHTPSNMVKLVLDWKDNQSRNKGLYKLVQGKPVAHNPDNPLLPGYDPPDQNTLDLYSRLRQKGFKLENKLRSPWYDRQCDRPGATPQSIAQELDRDYGGSVHRIMGPTFFKKVKDSVLPFRYEGAITVSRAKNELSFQEVKDGPLKIWCNLDHSNRPPLRPYAIAADISSGLGGSHTSNSVIQVIDLITMTQVMEYATNIVEPSEFGEQAVAIAKWFHDAYLAWEINYGGGFTKRVKELGYPNLYMRTIWGKRGKRKTQDIGWHTNQASKEAGFADLIRKVEIGEIKIRSDALRQECGEYVLLAGKIEHLTATKNPSDATKGAAHGDRVMAMVVAIQAAIDRPVGKSLDINDQTINANLIPPYSMAARMAEWNKGKATDEWDDREVGKLTGRSS